MAQVRFSKCGILYPRFCGGTLVVDKDGRQWVITAAHCISDLGPEVHPIIDYFEIRVGSVFLNDTENTQIRNVSVDLDHVVIHPEYPKNIPEDGDPFCKDNCTDFCPRYCDGMCCHCDTEDYSGRVLNLFIVIHNFYL